MPYRSSLCLMAAMIRDGEISPPELVDAHLQQIERVNPALNAFVSVMHERARQDASDAAARLARGDAPGMLEGVPLTVKDSFDIAGEATLCGSRLRIGHRAAEDSTAVARLRTAGAVILGKTNCPEFLLSYETDNYIAGRTNNPWSLEHTPGGSSGGEAAAIAALCSPGGIGSDGGGSIRVPAHFCGIAGLKPTPGRVSATGHFPLISHPGGLLGVSGPMARSARDLALLFSVLAGYDDQDPFSAPVPLRTIPRDGLRVGLWDGPCGPPSDPSGHAAVHAVESALEDIRIPVEPFPARRFERSARLWWFFFGQLPARTIREMIRGREADVHWSGSELMQRALDEPEPTASDVLTHLATRDRLRAALLREMRQVPVLLMPPAALPAFPHRARNFDVVEVMAPATFANLFGLPAIVIPFGFTSGGLPVGVQLVGRPYEEELLLDLAVKLEESRGPFPSPPMALR